MMIRESTTLQNMRSLRIQKVIIIIADYIILRLQSIINDHTLSITIHNDY